MLSRIRGFEITKGYEDKGINLPIQMTMNAAGYDFEAAEDIVIPSIFKQFMRFAKKQVTRQRNQKLDIRPTKIPTGIKVYMPEDEFLGLYNRSSNPLNFFLIMANGVAVIDSDYYNNKKTDGHIHFQFYNLSFFDRRIKKGDRIGQGVFHKYLKADKGAARESGKERLGGEGSTNNEVANND